MWARIVIAILAVAVATALMSALMPAVGQNAPVSQRMDRSESNPVLCLWFGDGRRLPVPVDQATAMHRLPQVESSVGRFLRWWLGDGRRLPGSVARHS